MIPQEEVSQARRSNANNSSPLKQSSSQKELHSGLTPELGILTLDDEVNSLHKTKGKGRSLIVHDLVPVKLEDHFHNIKSDIEEDKHEAIHREEDFSSEDQELIDIDEHFDKLPSSLSIIQLARDRRARRLGRFGLASEALSMRPHFGPRPQPYSISFLAAITQEAVVGAQLIEGGVDSSVFENFLH